MLPLALPMDVVESRLKLGRPETRPELVPVKVIGHLMVFFWSRVSLVCCPPCVGPLCTLLVPNGWTVLLYQWVLSVASGLELSSRRTCEY